MFIPSCHVTVNCLRFDSFSFLSTYLCRVSPFRPYCDAGLLSGAARREGQGRVFVKGRCFRLDREPSQARVLNRHGSRQLQGGAWEPRCNENVGI